MSPRGPSFHDAFDVAVVGGGPAGIAAALGAERVGARTLLVEREPRLGGNAANAFVHTICGLYEPADRDPAAPARYAHAGFPRRFAEALRARGLAGDPERAGKVHYLSMDPAGFSQLAREQCEAAAGLTLAASTRLVALSLDEGTPRLDLAASAGDPEPGGCRARIVIDTSGDATAAALAGLPTASADRRQRPSFILALRGCETARLEGFERMRTTHAIQGAVRSGTLPEACESVTVRPGVRPGEVFVTLTLAEGPAEGDLTEDAAMPPLLAEARSHAARILDFLRAERAAFVNAEVAQWPSRVGVRETRRVVGVATLTESDVLTGRGDADEVARSTWPIELWESHRRARFQHPAGACSIPLGCLVSRQSPRLGMAGRCISATHEALGAARVIGTSLATGEAIGVAAALAATRDGTLADVRPEAVREAIAPAG